MPVHLSTANLVSVLNSGSIPRGSIDSSILSGPTGGAGRSDNFNRANSSSALGQPSDNGSNYVVVNSATFGITNGTAYLVAGSGYAVLDVGALVGELDILSTRTSATGNAYLVLATDTTLTHGYALRYTATSSGLSLIRMDGSTPDGGLTTSLKGTPDTAATAWSGGGTSTQIRLLRDPTGNLSAYVGAVQVFNSTLDNTYVPRVVAFGSDNANIDTWGFLAARISYGTALVWDRSWTSGQSYNVGNLVAYLGSTYICISAVSSTTPPPQDNGHWDVIALQGEPGVAGTIAVGTVTGLTTGATPTVHNSGTGSSAILDFGIPAGPLGPTGPAGNTVRNGAGAPTNIVGNNGDYYLDNNTTTLYGPKTSGTWPTPGTPLMGAPGSTGASGNTVLHGTGAPSNASGQNGDFYIDTAASVFYGPKANNVWPGTGTLIQGSRGNSVLNGAGTPSNSVGVNGDYYIDNNATTLYGPKSGGAWPLSGTSLIPTQTLGVVYKSGNSWPTRPSNYPVVLWIGAAPGPTIGGTGNAINGVDLWDDIS